MVFALGSWKVQARIRRSISATGSAASFAGVGAWANRARATGKLVSSRVRIDRTQATRISKTEECPSAASSNRAAFGYGAIAARKRGIAASMSKVRGPPLFVLRRGFFALDMG